MPTSSVISKQKHAQQLRIQSLLQDTTFARTMADKQDATYVHGIRQTSPLLPEPDDAEFITKSAREEKIAINLAGFYALECGVAAITQQTGETFVTCLQRIINDNLGKNEILLVNHFANTTWKAGQPFRDLERIKRPVFTVFSLLPPEEQQKDLIQIRMAAQYLLRTMEGSPSQTHEKQLAQLQVFLQDPDYALEIAIFLEASYYTGQSKIAPPFLSREEELAVISKRTGDQRIAMNLAGFYALESGVDYLSTVQNKLPSEVIKSIADDQLPSTEKLLLCRFANAAWKAGQPFRGMERISRAVFIPFDLLSDAEAAKDWAQIKSAAKLLLSYLQ
jgi:hypothetical protein